MYGLDKFPCDEFIQTDITFSMHIVENKSGNHQYPSEELLLKNFCGVSELIIGGFHYSDCVKKIGEAALNMGINCLADLDLTDLFFNLYNTDYFDQIISLIVNIMENNTRVYAECISILTKLLSFVDIEERNLIIDNIIKKLRNESSTEYLDIWLQRLTIADNSGEEYNSTLCKKIYETNKIWDCSWSKYLIDESMIVDTDIVSSIPKIVTPVEIDDFLDDIY